MLSRGPFYERFSIVIQIHWKIDFRVTSPWGIISLQNYAHATTAHRITSLCGTMMQQPRILWSHFVKNHKINAFMIPVICVNFYLLSREFILGLPVNADDSMLPIYILMNSWHYSLHSNITFNVHVHVYTIVITISQSIFGKKILSFIEKSNFVFADSEKSH